jgi:hypothetical protein
MKVKYKKHPSHFSYMLRNWVEIWFSYKEIFLEILATKYPRKHILLAILKILKQTG